MARITKETLAEIRRLWGGPSPLKKKDAQEILRQLKRCSKIWLRIEFRRIIPPKGRMRSPQPRRNVQRMQSKLFSIMGQTLWLRFLTFGYIMPVMSIKQQVRFMAAAIKTRPKMFSELQQLIRISKPSSPEGQPLPTAPSTPGSSP
jgi:hypothetical protein